jgi:serine/threonine-protein kinase
MEEARDEEFRAGRPRPGDVPVSEYGPAALADGAVFHGRYEIVRCLAAGGMGAVYECVHLTTQKHRALKVMLPQVLASSGMRQRFELEARVTASIDSEHIVETFDAGVDEVTGAPFLVMELLRGDDLANLLAQHGPFSPQEVVVLLSQAAMALEKTHAAGIVHRDLKPENLFLTRRDDGSPRLKILDFGIAKVVADGTKTSRNTAAIGTPLYMAPEQTTGEGAIGPAADLYALGHIAYTLLSGQAYWTEEQEALPVYALLSRMLEGPTEPPSARGARSGIVLSAAFDDWFARATARNQAARFDRASTQIGELAAVLGTPTLASTPPALSQRLSTPRSVDRPDDALRAGFEATLGRPGSPTHAGLATEEASRPLPVTSRFRTLVVAGFGLLALAAGLFGAARAFQNPAAARASAVVITAAAVSTSAAEPRSEAPPAATSPAVEPASVATSANPSPSPAPSVERPKKGHGWPTPPAPMPTAKPTAAPNCNPPFTVDSSGAKHAKPECL